MIIKVKLFSKGKVKVIKKTTSLNTALTVMKDVLANNPGNRVELA